MYGNDTSAMMLQQLFGYRAIEAGLVLGPGVLVITLLAPVRAQPVQRGIVHLRILLFGALIVVGISMLHSVASTFRPITTTSSGHVPCRVWATRSSSFPSQC